MSKRSLSRRNFLATTAGAVAATGLLSNRRSYAGSANEQLNVASVGVAGKGRSDLSDVANAKNVNVVALCDVDANSLAGAAKRYSDAKTFADYRKMLDSMQKDIDAVIVSTPDHMHGPIALMAMDLGMHVYCQKPLAHNLLECRAMQKMAAKNPKLKTQMGTQIHSHAAYRTGTAAVRAGAIGKVSEVHAWVGKSWSGPVTGRPDRTDPVPKHLNWDLWLGVAQERPYVARLYHPANWRKWIDFGAGTLGDMGCHIFDPVFTALELAAPTKVVSRGPQNHKETFAPDSDVVYAFNGTKYTNEAISFRWTDGSKQSRPDASKAQLPKGVKLPGAGAFFVGEKGVMVLPHVSMPKFYSQGEPMEVKIENIPFKNHYHEWADACRGEGETSTPFAYSCPVTEAVLTGTVAGRFKDHELTWDSETLKFNDDEANAVVGRKYRKGRELKNL